MDVKTIAKQKWEALLKRLPSPLARTLWLVQQTAQGFIDHEGSARAATIAYYAFFSVFPLVLFIITAASFLLEDQVTRQQIYAYTERYIPQFSGLVQQNVEQVLDARGAISLVAAVSMLWSASGVFSTVSHAINRAWGIKEHRPLWEEKFLSLGMALAVSLMFLLSVAASVTFSLVGQWSFLDTSLPAFNHALRSVLSIALPMFLVFVLLILVYRVVPSTPVPWRAVLTGAALTTIAWEIGKDAFTFYLVHFARYKLVYGQVEAFIILLLYFYFVGVILLVGAEFTAVSTRLFRDDDERAAPHSAPERQ